MEPMTVNGLKHMRDMSKQTFEKKFFIFIILRDSWGLDNSFHTLFKLCYKTRNNYSITLTFGTDK